MQGANRCASHGGYRQNPKHPATVRLYREGTIEEKARAIELARAQRGDPKTQEMRLTLRNLGIVADPITIEQAIQASQDKSGRAWRRFIKQKDAENKGNKGRAIHAVAAMTGDQVNVKERE